MMKHWLESQQDSLCAVWQLQWGENEAEMFGIHCFFELCSNLKKKKIFKMNTNVQEYANLLNGLFKLSLYELSSSSLSSRTRKLEF